MKNQYQQVLNELIVRHREAFETNLAFTLLRDSHCVNSVVKISNTLAAIFQEFQGEMIAIIHAQPKINDDLYNPELYGHLIRQLGLDPCQQMTKVLLNAEKNPIQALHVQMVFIHRIYDHLSSAKETLATKKYWVDKIFNSDLFADRARKAIETPRNASYKQGICRLRFFNQKVQLTTTHKPAKEKYKVDENSLFYKSASQHLMPTICGPSGHTGSLVLLAGMLNIFNHDEWQDYALIVASYLVAAGCHSFHESMMVSKTADVIYNYGNYQSMFSHKSQNVSVTALLTQHAHLLAP